MPTAEIERIRADFQMRYYQWALNDAHREISDGFPLLRKIKLPPLCGFLAWMEELSVQQQHEVFAALIKKTHREAVATAGDRPTEREELLDREHRARWMRAAQADTQVLHQQLAGTWRRCNRKKLSQLVREYAKPVFGCDIESGGSSGFRFKVDLKGYVIYTYFDFGGRSSDMSYLHLVTTSNGERVQHSISLLVWLGIFQTEWQNLTNAELEPAARMVVEFCQHFTSAAGSLLPDLKRPG